jgi:hypothetical protein
MRRPRKKPPNLRLHQDEDGSRFRNIPLNLDDRRTLLPKRMSVRRELHLNWLEAEFAVLRKRGIIVYEEPRARD